MELKSCDIRFEFYLNHSHILSGGRMGGWEGGGSGQGEREYNVKETR